MITNYKKSDRAYCSVECKEETFSAPGGVYEQRSQIMREKHERGEIVSPFSKKSIKRAA